MLRHRPVAHVLMALAFGVLLTPGCSQDECHKAIRNLPPETYVSYGPLERTCSRLAVQVYCTGDDPDGDVVAFEVATLRGVTEAMIEELDYDVLPWGITTSRESVFVVNTDSCCVSEDAPPESLVHWGVLVRAVDNLGAADPEPANAFFEACNVLPKVAITCPDVPDLPVPACLPARFYLEWEGEDPDGDEAEMEYKYIAVHADELGPGPDWGDLPPLSHEGSSGSHASPPLGMWSEWVSADCTYVCDLDLSDCHQHPMCSKYVVITARDEGGAVLTHDFWSIYNNDANWIEFGTCTPDEGVELIIHGDGLGRRSSRRSGEYLNALSAVIWPGEVRFKFFAEEDKRGCESATVYRYYYGGAAEPETWTWGPWTSVEPIRREGESPEWVVWFPESRERFTPWPGYVFAAEVKDICGVVSHCELRFEVVEGIRIPRRAYLVDDDRAYWLDPWWQGYEDEQDAFWEDVLNGYDWVGFDTGRSYDEKVPVRDIANSRTVIWVVDADMENPATQLLQVCSGNLGNYLHGYVEIGANLIVIGLDPVFACGYWADGTPYPAGRKNCTSWDFRPKWISAEQETVHHWMWDVFGIKKMSIAMPSFPFTALWPCDECAEAFRDTIQLGPQASRIGGKFGNAAYITQLRDDINVLPLYSTARQQDGEWIDSGSNRVIAVYVPSDGMRGHAAYVGVPAYWFDHDKMKTMIRRLLDLFGQQPLSP